MRLLHVIHSVNPSGGGPIEGVKQLARAHAAVGVSVEVVSLDAPGDAWIRDFPLPVYPMGPAHLSYGYSPRLVPWLKEHHRGYDAVIVNGIWQYNSFGVWRALRGSDKPYFLFAHGMLDPWFKRNYPVKHLKKWLYWPWAEYRVLRDARAVLFTCEEELLQARRSFWLYRCTEAVVSYGTAPPPGDAAAQRMAFLEKFPQLEGRRFLLFLGRVHEKKGCDLLIRALAEVRARLPEAEELFLVVAGPAGNAFGEEMKQLTVELGLAERTIWAGMLMGDLKWGALRCADAFVLPSHQENFGIAVSEALACGTPVLISDKVNIWREICEDGAALVENDDFAGTKKLIERWVALTPSERTEMQERAAACFGARYDITQAACNLLEVLGGFIKKTC